MVQKTINILVYLSDHPRGSSLSTIARELNIPKTTTFDILKTLMTNDFVRFVNPGEKNYCIGAQVNAIGKRCPADSP